WSIAWASNEIRYRVISDRSLVAGRLFLPHRWWWRTFLRWLVADGLDVVAVGIEAVAAVVVGVVDRAQAGRAIVDPACLDGCRVEGVHLRAALGAQRNVQPAP